MKTITNLTNASGFGNGFPGTEDRKSAAANSGGKKDGSYPTLERQKEIVLTMS
jgi:hypothetical protein